MRVKRNNKEEVTSKKESNKQSKTIPTINVVHILDASGSMTGGKFSNSIEGIKQEIYNLKNEKNINYTFSLIEFDSNRRILTIIDKEEINNINEFEDKLFKPFGMTALYDAIGNTLTNLKPNKGDKVLIKIFTDGGENNSINWSRDDLSKLIKEKEEEGWVITFVGTEFDTKTIIRNLRIDVSNTLTYDGTAKGLKDAYEVSNEATLVYSKQVLVGEDSIRGFYNNNKK